MKQGLGVRGQGSGGIQEKADDLLESIGQVQGVIEHLTAEFNAEVERIKTGYETKLQPLREDIVADEKALIALMKKERTTFFDGSDVYQLENGTLIHEVGDKVTIPRTALAKCEELEFTDVIKIAKSLDREAVEKWPDGKLFLIGAERKPVESFKYDLKQGQG